MKKLYIILFLLAAHNGFTQTIELKKGLRHVSLKPGMNLSFNRQLDQSWTLQNIDGRFLELKRPNHFIKDTLSLKLYKRKYLNHLSDEGYEFFGQIKKNKEKKLIFLKPDQFEQLSISLDSIKYLNFARNQEKKSIMPLLFAGTVAGGHNHFGKDHRNEDVIMNNIRHIGNAMILASVIKWTSGKSVKIYDLEEWKICG